MHRPGRADARSRMVTVIALLLLAAAPTLVLAAAGIGAPLAQAQVIPGVPELRMTIPQPLATRFRTTKRAADVQVLAQTYFVRDGIPHIRARGLEFPLIPVAKMIYRPTARQIGTSHQLPTAVAKYRDFILHRPIHIPEPPPDVVDRRSLQTPIKNQNPRGTCYAFASIAGLESAYGGGSLDLSENYANYWFMKRDGHTCQQSGVGAYEWGQVLYQHGVCTETICPYLVAPYPGYCNSGSDPAPAKRADASAHSPYRTKTYQSI